MAEGNPSNSPDQSSRSDPTIEEQLTCPLCHKLFEDPKVLPCLHIMCKACIESLEGGVHCPGCKTPVAIPQNGVSKLPTAFFIANMIEATKTLKKAHEPNTVCGSCGSGNEAAAYCTDCASFLCKDCCLNHRLMKVLKEHKVTEIKDADKSKLATKVVGFLCPKHTSGKLELYCCTCTSLVCYECVYLEHPKPQHDVKLLKECIAPSKEAVYEAVTSLLEEMKADVPDAVASLVHCDAKLQNVIEEVNVKKGALLERHDVVVQSINESFNHLVHFLQEKERILLSEVEKLFDSRKGDLDLQVISIELLQAHIRTVQSFLKYLDGHSCDEDFVPMQHLVCARIVELKEKCRELKQKLTSDAMLVPNVSCTNVEQPAGVWRLTVAMGDRVMQEVKVTNGPSVDFAVQTDEGEGQSTGVSGVLRGAMSSTNDADGASAGPSLEAGDNITRGKGKSPHGMPVSNLSPDVLYLLEKLPDGDIEGVVYRPSEGTAFIQGPTAEAVDQCITKVQSAVQGTIYSGQLKVEDVQHSSSLDPNYVLYLVAKLNTRHNQCVFVYMEEKSSVRVISNSPRHFDIAKKELSDYLDRLKSSKAKPPPLFAVKLCGNRVLTLKQSDLVTEDVEVIVNAANEDLSHGAGVALALDKASGGGLQKVSKAYTEAHGPVQMGCVAVTASGGGSLKCMHVYHVVGPKAYDYSPNDCRSLIEQIVEQVLMTAEHSGIPSVALPAISSGIFGVDKDLVAEVIIGTILTYQFTSRPPVLGDIRIVINDSHTFECFAKYFNQRKKGVTTSPSIPTTPSTISPSIPTTPSSTSTPTSADVVKRGSTGGHVPTSAGAVGDITYPNLNGSSSAFGDDKSSLTGEGQSREASGNIGAVFSSSGASSNDLSNTIAAVACISGQWKELGSSLGLQPVILDAIQGPPEECMVVMMTRWAHEAMAASRQRLSSALVKMGRTDLAERVMEGVQLESAGSSLDASDNIARGPPLKSPHGMPLPNLSPDVLYLLEKLPDGDIEGVVYRPSEGTAFIQGPTAEAVDQCITKVQSALQKVISPGQLKVENVQPSSSLDPNYVLYLVAKLNIRHNQCVCVYMEEKSSVRVISNSPQQFDIAKKEICDCLKSSKVKPPPLFAVKLCGNRVLTLKQSDLVTEDVEVIVNTANEKLDCGAGGVAKALDIASRGGLQKVSKAYTDAHGPVQMGGVAVTASGGGALKCNHVYHVVGPKASDYSPNDCRRLIGQVVEQVLITAEHSGILSVALPAICSGIYKVDKDLVAEVIIDTILTHQFTSRPPVLGDIRIVISDSPTFECFAKYFNQKKKVMTTSPSIPTTPSTTSTPTSADVVKRGSTGGHVPTSAGAVGGDGRTGYDTPVDGHTSRCTIPKTGTVDNCPICLGPPQNPVTSRCCQKVYCKACFEQSLKSFPNCPTCRKFLREGVLGDQPPGTMNAQYQRTSLPGYDGCGSIVITYNLPDGRQGPEHPSPGQHYTGTQRTAYLPDNQEGREVLQLLKKAWDAKVIFTIGTSVTSGHPNTVIWNGIHHKTNTYGGSHNYGYPDPTYLSRVKQELAAKGIR